MNTRDISSDRPRGRSGINMSSQNAINIEYIKIGELKPDHASFLHIIEHQMEVQTVGPIDQAVAHWEDISRPAARFGQQAGHGCHSNVMLCNAAGRCVTRSPITVTLAPATPSGVTPVVMGGRGCHYLQLLRTKPGGRSTRVCAGFRRKYADRFRRYNTWE
jgi:hypothetical protein